MADVASALRSWSATAGSNLPSGSTVIGAGLDDNLRTIQAVVRQYLASTASNMASAATVDLSTADGFYVNITGGTTITSLGTESAGVHYVLKFASALTLTHNATSLILPGGANITTVAGDIAWMMSEGSGNWRCVNYQSNASTPLGLPVGTIIDFAGTAAPTGYLACPTSATNISRTTYAALFAAIGTTWGTGDGSTTFGMPYFPEGYASVQASGNVATATVGQVIAHTHTVNLTSEMAAGSNSGSLRSGSTTNTGSTGGSANLAAGLKVLKCVKYI